ncbi:type II secretion system protein N [Rhizobacter sp. Root404]|uniref:type II secretion system protein N n=1 Tax=Rhizobacter sp. Root404 TaxID=1736528 RepID=UPI000B06AB61|nr:type II secretion system protein N [Rhizobacter sp. Root404]
MIRLRAKKRTRGLFAPTVAATGWGESTFAELSWDKSRNAGLRWGIAGAVLGLLAALIVFAPAAWLAGAVASASQQRLILADARGTIWTGSAVVVLTGGEGSRDASSLPGRLAWTLRPAGLGLALRLEQACCLNGTVGLRVQPGFGRTTYTLVPPSGWVGQWPTAFLGGLGTPFNTMQLGGTARLVSPGLKLESVQGRWLVDGRAELELVDVSSRLSTLESLGSYRMSLAGDAANPGISLLTLTTQDGALKLSGTGTVGPAGVRFRGEARAGAVEEAALSNLLNIIGRRDGARSVISIG